jgi:hypothetical protein
MPREKGQQRGEASRPEGRRISLRVNRESAPEEEPTREDQDLCENL